MTNRPRDNVLDAAKSLINGARADRYGAFRDQMESIAGAFNALHRKPKLVPEDVALILLLLKQKRMLTSGFEMDNMVDTCGYAALMYEAFGKAE